MGLFPPNFASYLFMLEMITRLAGRFTPAARVGVDAINFIFPFLNSDSID
jgi:hypothetical protein